MLDYSEPSHLLKNRETWSVYGQVRELQKVEREESAGVPSSPLPGEGWSTVGWKATVQLQDMLKPLF